jgi:hypothetical protein
VKRGLGETAEHLGPPQEVDAFARGGRGDGHR